MTTEWEMVAGIEVHVQLDTESKMFCSCLNEYGNPPNLQTCPVCLGLPGSLPVVNRRAIDFAIQAGMALNCKIAPYTKFDRKNYFYPDLPKNYQISQYDLPLCKGGYLEVNVDGKETRIGITRLHMEEDTGKSIHEDNGDTKVDLNRAGTPLIEIVSEPDIRHSEEAYAYLTTLKSTLRYIGISDCNMEQGSLRCDVNVSLRPRGQEKFGVKVEVKNLNSFRNVANAIEFEKKRQAKVLEGGGEIFQETRLYDAQEGVTRTMRRKEEAFDYRYFPEPDIPPLKISEKWMEELRQALPELPQKRLERYQQELGLSDYDAGVLVADKELSDYYEQVLSHFDDPKLVANWITNAIKTYLNDEKISAAELDLPPEKLAHLLQMVNDEKISNNNAEVVLMELIEKGGEAEKIAKEKDLLQVSDDSVLEDLVQEAIEANPQAVKDFREGKKQAVGALIGYIMRNNRSANPQKVSAMIREELEKLDS